jgi:ABC-type multidrug transport system ATPase subunit
MLGENGTGKTTLIKLLAGKKTPDDVTIEMPEL